MLVDYERARSYLGKVVEFVFLSLPRSVTALARSLEGRIWYAIGGVPIK
jgi:hypothetical protein